MEPTGALPGPGSPPTLWDKMETSEMKLKSPSGAPERLLSGIRGPSMGPFLCPNARPCLEPQWGILVSSRRFPFYQRAWAGPRPRKSPCELHVGPGVHSLVFPARAVPPYIPGQGAYPLNSRQGLRPLIFPARGCAPLNSRQGVLSPIGGLWFNLGGFHLSKGVGGPQAPGGPMWAPCRPRGAPP